MLLGSIWQLEVLSFTFIQDSPVSCQILGGTWYFCTIVGTFWDQPVSRPLADAAQTFNLSANEGQLFAETPEEEKN